MSGVIIQEADPQPTVEKVEASLLAQLQANPGDCRTFNIVMTESIKLADLRQRPAKTDTFQIMLTEIHKDGGCDITINHPVAAACRDGYYEWKAIKFLDTF
jgi:hypothetical protein